MADQESLGWAVAMTLLGAGVLAHAVLCWTGRLRGWTRRAWWDQWVLGFAPGLGALVLGVGLLRLFGKPVGPVIGSVLVLAGFVLLVPGMVYVFFEPRWWGPRWFRRLSARERRPDIRDPLTALMVAGSAGPRCSSWKDAARAATAYGPVTGRWRAGHVYDPDTRDRAHGMAWRGTVTGTLTLYRAGLSFAGAPFEDTLRGEPSVIALASGDIVSARVVPPRAGPDGVPRRGILWRSLLPRVVIETKTSGEYVFEVTFAKRVAARVAETVRQGVASE